MRAHNFKSKVDLEVNMSNGYRHHYHTARQKFIDWFYSKHHPQLDTMEQMRSLCLEDEEMVSIDDELKFALESFDECEQVKILYNYDSNEHCLKIKWEHSPWWQGQVLHFYYCIMLPIDNANFRTPYQLATGEIE